MQIHRVLTGQMHRFLLLHAIILRHNRIGANRQRRIKKRSRLLGGQQYVALAIVDRQAGIAGKSAVGGGIHDMQIIILPNAYLCTLSKLETFYVNK